MKRREFLAASAAATVGLAAPARAQSASGGGRDLIELRTYHFASPEKQKAFEDFLADVAIPALNRAGIRPVGVWKLRAADNPRLKLEADSTDLYVLLTHKSCDSLIGMIPRLSRDSWFTSDGAEILMAPKESPAYTRFESSLLLAFEGMPHVEAPTMAADRVLQLRTYESHNDERALAKIHMFNEGGELAIFRRCGMTPAFFGQALIGDKLPNLTYALSFASPEAMREGWKKFGQDPGWKTLREDPTYKDTVSRITNLVLRPARGSQI
ncbi:MAG: NIPSNAP family containing protein [Verrucomicrobia bacterium]|nr:MAG: NIPSNAP family containing protein [Verrucomicrobiota bacterium]